MKIPLVRPAVVVLLLLAASIAAGNEGHASAGAAPHSELGASAAFAADGSLWAVAKAGGHVVLRRSNDRGSSWSDPIRVNAAAEAIAADGDARPKLALGPQNDIYVSWTQPLSRPYSGAIRFARSADAAGSFSVPLTVNRDRAEISHRFDALVVNAEGKVFVAWVDKRDQELATKAQRNYRGAAIYVAVSGDRGESFGPEQRVADHSCECCRIALAANPDGSVWALWRHVFAPNVRDHAAARIAADGTPGPIKRATADDWRIDACPHHGPGLAVDAEAGVHAVWYTGGPRGGVFYGRVEAEGGVANRRRLGGDGAAHADIVSAGRRILVVWKEFDGHETQLKASVSDDLGATWRDRLLAATNGASDQPRALVHGNRFLVFWHSAERPFATFEAP